MSSTVPDAGGAAVATDPPVDAILYAGNLRKEFGGLVAVNDVSLDIPRGSIISLIGPNGAGKTTFFNMLTGLYKPTSGDIWLNDRNITRLRPDQITSREWPGRSRTSACSGP